jgi:hypothetical protein
MSKGLVLALALLSLLASCVIVANPVAANTVTQNSWAELAPMHQARAYPGVGVVDGKIYAIGGEAENGVVGTNEEYDPATNTWVFKASMPVPMSAFVTAVFQNKVYCIGSGLNEVYDPKTDTWENKSAPSANGAVFVIDDKIFLVGQSATLVYDTKNNSWTAKAAMPVPLKYYNSFIIDNKINVIGANSASFSTVLNQTYDTETNKWTMGTVPPFDIGYGSSAATSGVFAPKLIYFINDNGQGDYITQFFNPSNDSWGTGASMPTSRGEFNLAVLNDKLYAIGGATVSGEYLPGFTGYSYKTNYFATVEEYTPFGYGTVPPTISIDSLRSIDYSSNELALNFTTNKPVTSIAYSLDGQRNISISGNSTLTGLSSGKHNITVYASDTYGNMGASETVTFTISEPFPTTLAAAASGASIAAIIGIGLLIYFRKRNRYVRS